MIELIIGSKGSGKTKVLIDRVKKAVEETNGIVACIEKGTKLTFEIDHKVRLIDADSYSIEGFDAFYGFINGILSCNYDIKEIFVDGILRIGDRDVDGLCNLIRRLDAQVPDDVKIFFTVSANKSDLPDDIVKYMK